MLQGAQTNSNSPSASPSASDREVHTNIDSLSASASASASDRQVHTNIDSLSASASASGSGSGGAGATSGQLRSDSDPLLVESTSVRSPSIWRKMSGTGNAVSPEHLEEGGEPPRRESSINYGKERAWITCENMDYSIKKAHILKNINAVFPPGACVALMGSSGAGKTTLMNAIAARGHGTIGGKMTLNESPLTRKLMKSKSKMVPQLDVFEPVLTCRQTLDYVAALSLPGTAVERSNRVDEVLDMLSLRECQDVVVGGVDVKGLSGGQIKRVSIACELLSNPAILYLDEPTSGLDSSTASDVVDIIKALARGGRTIVCTIHQPSVQVFQKFDRLVMLDKGTIVYNGEVSKVSDYLEEIGRPCPTFVNPADHFMDLLTGEVPDPKCANFEELFLQTSFGERAKEYNAQEIENCRLYMERRKEKQQDTQIQSTYSNGFCTQFGVIFKRAIHITILDKRQLRVRVFQLIFLGLIIGTIYFRMEFAQDRAQDRLSVVFLVLLMLGMSSIMSTALAMPIEKGVAAREYANGYFSIGSYYSARLLSLLTFQTLYAVFFSAIVYYLLGLRAGFEYFMIFCLTLTLTSNICGCLGFAAGAALPGAQAIAAIVPSLVIPLTLFAGLFIQKSNIPDYWIWLYYLSFFNYSMQILVVNEFHDRDFEACNVEDILTPTGKCPFGACSADPTQPQPCPGDLQLAKLDYDADQMAANFLILVGFLIGITGIGFFFLRRLLVKNS